MAETQPKRRRGRPRTHDEAPVRTEAYLPPKLRARLDRYCEREGGMALTLVVQAALDAYLPKR